MLVLDFDQHPRALYKRDENRKLVPEYKEVTTEKDRRGWWFGAQDTYHNEHAGHHFAQVLSETLQNRHIGRQYSRSDLKLYLTDKADVLRDQLKLSNKEAQAAAALLDPIMIGKETGVTKVITGELVDAEMRHSRVFGLFGAGASVRVTLWDVATGRPDVVVSERKFKMFHGNYAIWEKVADKVATRLQPYLPSSDQ